ncbi:DsbA family oxidoreductase [Paenibacillus sp. MBLB4367]|uniref:DsbA family oxidoreductase n=1 Tax=Paenibacillus sp. MBLB4367 TaxID=3384767 RepID=UPI003907EB16
MIIDIYQDTVCPWCRIGKQNLQEALKEWQGEPVEIRYHAFQLDPGTPVEGLPFRETMTKKFGAAGSDINRIFGQVEQAGKAAGVNFDFSKVEYMPNTLLSHQLYNLVPEEKQAELVEAIYQAYFEDGRDIGDINVLLEIGESFGLDKESARQQLESKEKLPRVEKDLAFAKEVGITGVPFFILNNKFALSGAQPPNVFAQALEKAKQG